MALSQAVAHDINALGNRSKPIKNRQVSKFCNELARGGWPNISWGVALKKCKMGLLSSVVIV
jgi:hypothetical protein